MSHEPAARDHPSGEDVARLRREMRALAVVNRQLQADLEGRGLVAVAAPRERIETPPPAGAPVSAGLGPFRSVITQVRGGEGPGAPVRLVTNGGRTFLVEGRTARPVPSSLVAAVLEEVVGSGAPIDDAALGVLAEGDDVEVLQGPGGHPFVAVAGRRVTVRGWPRLQRVAADVVDALDDGEEVDVARLVAARRAPTPPEPSHHPTSAARRLGAAGRSALDTLRSRAGSSGR